MNPVALMCSDCDEMRFFLRGDLDNDRAGVTEIRANDHRHSVVAEMIADLFSQVTFELLLERVGISQRHESAFVFRRCRHAKVDVARNEVAGTEGLEFSSPAENALGG